MDHHNWAEYRSARYINYSDWRKALSGEFGNQAVLLNLTSLPEHNEIAITFDLFIIRTMDGNDSRWEAGPDIWSLGIVDGPTLIQTHFPTVNVDTDPR